MVALLRLAVPDDVAALRELIPVSVRALSRGYYSEAQIESAIRYVFGPDTQLIADETYFVVEAQSVLIGSVLIGCGGWSRRRTLYGGDQGKSGEDALLDPASDPARIRAFFVHPEWARQGIASQIMAACFEAAQTSGFRHLELMAALPGEPLYHAFGFETAERVKTVLPDGITVPFVRMVREMSDSCS